MKKIYPILLAAAVAMSASGAERHKASYRQHKVEVAASMVKSLGESKRMAPAKVAATTADLEKMVEWNSESTLENSEGPQTYALEIVFDDESTGEVTIILDGTMYFELKGQFDAEAGTISIPTHQEFEDLDEGDMFYIKVLGDDDDLAAGDSGIEAAVGVFDGTNFVFPEYEFWAFGNPDAEEYGYWELCYKNVFAPNSWVYLGEGKFTENILYPFFNDSENTVATDVEVYTNEEGSYKIMDPLRALYDSYDISAESPAITLEANADLGYLIGMTNSGLGNQNVGFFYFYSQSWFESKYGDPEDFFMPIYMITKSVEDGVATITIPVDATIIMTSGTSQEFQGSKYASILTFKEDSAGIGNVVAKDEAPAQYFNLQGMRVENGARGIVVRVQDGKAEKIFLK